MKPLQKPYAFLSFLLAFLLLFHSCTVYRKATISIDQAVKNGKNVKITNVNERKYKFKKIERADSLYYGITEIQNKPVKVPLQPKDIKQINEINKPVTTLLLVASIVIPLGLVAIIIAAEGISSGGSSPTSSLGSGY